MGIIALLLILWEIKLFPTHKQVQKQLNLLDSAFLQTGKPLLFLFAEILKSEMYSRF